MVVYQRTLCRTYTTTVLELGPLFCCTSKNVQLDLSIYLAALCDKVIAPPSLRPFRIWIPSSFDSVIDFASSCLFTQGGNWKGGGLFSCSSIQKTDAGFQGFFPPPPPTWSHFPTFCFERKAKEHLFSHHLIGKKIIQKFKSIFFPRQFFNLGNSMYTPFEISAIFFKNSECGEMQYFNLQNFFPDNLA